MAAPVLPPISASSNARSAVDQQGNVWDIGGGDWVVNMGGSGTAYQSAGESLPTWLIYAGAAVAAYAAWKHLT